MAGASWVAGAVRAQALSQRRIGAYQANEVARQSSLAGALDVLRGTAYGEQASEATSLIDALRAVDATVLWHFRVLAGWLPREGASGIETVAGWWELDNIRSVLARLLAGSRAPLHDLGPFATVKHLDQAPTVVAIRERLRISPWGDPGSDDPSEMLRYLRLRLALRISELGDVASRWACQRAAIWIAEDSFVDRVPSPRRVLRRLPRIAAVEPREGSLGEFVSRLHPDIAPLFAAVEQPSDLPDAEIRWWNWLENEAETRITREQLGPQTWLAAVALLGVDAWRTKAALVLASRGGGSLYRELVNVA